jgi:hypothetical protein
MQTNYDSSLRKHKAIALPHLLQFPAEQRAAQRDLLLSVVFCFVMFVNFHRSTARLREVVPNATDCLMRNSTHDVRGFLLCCMSWDLGATGYNSRTLRGDMRPISGRMPAPMRNPAVLFGAEGFGGVDAHRPDHRR